LSVGDPFEDATAIALALHKKKRNEKSQRSEGQTCAHLNLKHLKHHYY
jgi:hypothetical protein